MDGMVVKTVSPGVVLNVEAEQILDAVIGYLNAPRPRRPATLGELLETYPPDDLADVTALARAVSGQLRQRGAAEQSLVFDAVAVIADAARIRNASRGLDTAATRRPLLP